MLSDSIARAPAIPANHATRSLEDVEHIVVLMQENRSFDHYFGALAIAAVATRSGSSSRSPTRTDVTASSRWSASR
jgi:phospholipase C